ncbi:MAG: CPBP family glutamic-type intramembrane protease [Chthoniobacterales bacterium]
MRALPPADERLPAYPWRLFWVLVAGSVLGVLALLPYLSVVLRPMLAAHPLRLPLPVIVLIQGVTNFSVAVGLGILLARKIGLGAPILEAWLYNRAFVAPRRIVLTSCATGVILGAITFCLIHSHLGAALSSLPVMTEAAIPLWKRFLACLYGGLCEEILMRLFLLSLVIWLCAKLWKRNAQSPTAEVFWSSNILVAIAFGAGHLPLAARLVPLTPLLVSVVILLNAFASLGFGYLYWKRGLEAAIVAHFSADIVLHVLGPILVAT